MRTLDAIVARLEAQGVGTGGQNIFAGSDVDIPTGPTRFLTLIEAPGRPPVPSHNAKALRQPSLQVTARGDIYSEVSQLIEQTWDALGGEDGLSNIEIGGVFFLYIRPASDIFQLPNDATGRIRLAFNLNSQRR